MVLLPLPLGPTRATVWPSWIVKFKPFSTFTTFITLYYCSILATHLCVLSWRIRKLNIMKSYVIGNIVPWDCPFIWADIYSRYLQWHWAYDEPAGPVHSYHIYDVKDHCSCFLSYPNIVHVDSISCQCKKSSVSTKNGLVIMRYLLILSEIWAAWGLQLYAAPWLNSKGSNGV